MGKNYFYAVKAGRNIGIFETWDECKASVSGFKGNDFKRFDSREEAEAWMKADASELVVTPEVEDIESSGKPYAFVDGSFNINTGVYGFGGFLVSEGKKYFLSGSGSDPEMASMRNVAGEILGAMAAVEQAIELGLSSLSILYDYNGIEKWATGEWRRNKPETIAYHKFMQDVKSIIRIDFVKVKGHTGISGNEEADKIAKEAVGLL